MRLNRRTDRILSRKKKRSLTWESTGKKSGDSPCEKFAGQSP